MNRVSVVELRTALAGALNRAEYAGDRRVVLVVKVADRRDAYRR